MKVLFIIPESEQGGGQVYVYSIARGLLRRNIDVSFGVGREGWLSDRASEYGIPTKIFRHGKRSFSPYTIFRFIFELRRHLVAHPVDILHLHGSNALFGVMSARLVKKRPKVFFTWGGLTFLHPEWKESRAVKAIGYFIFRLLLPFVDRSIFVCTSDYDYAKEVRLIGKKQEKKCVVIYNGVDERIDFVPREEARDFLESRIEIPLTDKFIIGCIARFEYQKNIEMLIDIARSLHGIRTDLIYLVIGYGDLSRDLTKKIRECGLEKIFFLIHSVNDAYRFLKAFDIFALTSRYEGLPFTLLEARLAGVPTISTKVGGISEVVNDGQDGFVVDLHDIGLYKNRLAQIITDASLRSTFTTAAERITREHFTHVLMVGATYLQYRTLLRE